MAQMNEIDFAIGLKILTLQLGLNSCTVSCHSAMFDPFTYEIEKQNMTDTDLRFVLFRNYSVEFAKCNFGVYLCMPKRSRE